MIRLLCSVSHSVPFLICLTSESKVGVALLGPEYAPWSSGTMFLHWNFVFNDACFPFPSLSLYSLRTFSDKISVDVVGERERKFTNRSFLFLSLSPFISAQRTFFL